MKHIFLGIGGSGMRGLAYLLEQQGEIITGYDDNPNNTKCSFNEALVALSNADLLVYTDAAREDHPLRIAARDSGISEIPYQRALGELSKGFTTIAVTGTHGKSSTTAFLAHIAIQAGLDPTVLVGANMPTLPGGHARLGKGKYFIVEADEYRRHFLELQPAHIIITCVDFDHPDAFTSLADTERAYSEFISTMQPNGSVITPLQEQKAHPAISWPSNIVSVSEEEAEGILAPIPGKHMQMNAALACTAAEILGISINNAQEELKSFPGLSRRFELLGTYNGIEVRSDYGHHPAEIAATIKGARHAYPEHHLIAIFEAHMPLRLHTFLQDFANALMLADSVIIVPPFVPAGRDSENTNKDVVYLVQALTDTKKAVVYINNISQLLPALAAQTQGIEKHSIAIGFSAGILDNYLRKSVKES